MLVKWKWNKCKQILFVKQFQIISQRAFPAVVSVVKVSTPNPARASVVGRNVACLHGILGEWFDFQWAVEGGKVGKVGAWVGATVGGTAGGGGGGDVVVAVLVAALCPSAATGAGADGSVWLSVGLARQTGVRRNGRLLVRRALLALLVALILVHLVVVEGARSSRLIEGRRGVLIRLHWTVNVFGWHWRRQHWRHWSISNALFSNNNKWIRLTCQWENASSWPW